MGERKYSLIILTLALDGGEWSALRTDCFTRGGGGEPPVSNV
jgi:hypothetical protein